MNEEAITPRELSAELGVSQKRIRDFLRGHAPAGHLKYQRWSLTASQADTVRAHFRSN